MHQNTRSVAARSSSSNTFYKIYSHQIIITQFLMPFLLLSFCARREFSFAREFTAIRLLFANALHSHFVQRQRPHHSFQFLHSTYSTSTLPRSHSVCAPCYRLKQYCNRILYKLVSLFTIVGCARCLVLLFFEFSLSFAFVCYISYSSFSICSYNGKCWNPLPTKHEMNVVVLWGVCVCVALPKRIARKHKRANNITLS